MMPATGINGEYVMYVSVTFYAWKNWTAEQRLLDLVSQGAFDLSNILGWLFRSLIDFFLLLHLLEKDILLFISL